MDVGDLLGLNVHHIESAGDTFASGKTTCGLAATMPPLGGIQGYDVRHDLALTTAVALVTCERCIETFEESDPTLL